MPKMFISYRRSASAGHAGRLYDRLIAHYGDDNVFLDVEQIPVGETFSTYLLAQIDECDVFLLMLGEGTLDRCADPEDWVRREIAYALDHKHIVVIPVLQDGYRMPNPETLPVDIQGITLKNASFLFHQMFDESVNKLIESIDQLFPQSTKLQSDKIPIQVKSYPPLQVSRNTSTGTAQVRIHRVGNMVMYRARPFTIKLNGRELGNITNNETVTLDVPAGQHELSVHVDYHHPARQITIAEGETLNFTVQVKNMGLNVTLDPA